MTREELLNEQEGFIRAVLEKYGPQAFEITTTQNPQVITFPDLGMDNYLVDIISYKSGNREAKNSCVVVNQTGTTFQFTAPDRYPTGILIFKIIKKTVL
jgi:hypothetical protein